MEKRDIDCLIIGCNQMVFSEYVGHIKKMGESSGAFRDLNLSYCEEGDIIQSCSDYCNKYYFAESGVMPMSYDNIFSATVAYLGSFLNRNALSFAYINSYQEGKEDLISILKHDNIRTIAITTTYYVSVLPVLEIVNLIRQYNKEVVIVIGGPFVNTQYKIHTEESFKYMLNQIGADIYVINSQGEQALVNVIQAVKNKSSFEMIENIIYRKHTQFVFNPFTSEDNKLNQNMVDWHLFGQEFSHTKRRMVMVRTATSCPFSCTFCSFPAHAGDYRYVTPDDVCRELDQLKQITAVNSVTFIDDTFNVPLRRFKDILRQFIERDYQFKWNCNFRCQYADEEAVALMKEAGCEGVFLGIESGSDRILKNMNKSATVEQYKKGIGLLKKYGILTYASLIIGFPGETEETVRETISLIESAQPDFFRAQLWYYDTMTPIHKEADKYGLQNSQFEWVHNTMNSKEAAAWVDYLHSHMQHSVWLPQNDFDFPSLFNLLSRGWTIPQIKDVLRSFNEKVYKKMHSKQLEEEEYYLSKQMLSDVNFDF